MIAVVGLPILGADRGSAGGMMGGEFADNSLQISAKAAKRPASFAHLTLTRFSPILVQKPVVTAERASKTARTRYLAALPSGLAGAGDWPH